MNHLHHDKLCRGECEPAAGTQAVVVDVEDLVVAFGKGLQDLSQLHASRYEARAFILILAFSKFRLHRESVLLTIFTRAAHRPLPPSAARKCLHISHVASVGVLAETTILCA
jgi:hypothetical protein